MNPPEQPPQPKRFIARLNALCTPRAQRIFMRLSWLVLMLTTVYWSLLGAWLHNGNADQLVDSYMLADSSSAAGAQFPAAHTMLLKWPIFWLVGHFGTTGWPTTVATIAVCVATIAFLAWVIGRIEPRPLPRALWYTVLAGILLYVPLAPYAGGILPVQMAMLTTRNIEYAVYLAAIILLVRTRRHATYGYLFGVVLLALLFMSDRLFVGLALGATVLLLLSAAVFCSRRMLEVVKRFGVGAAGAVVLTVVGNFVVTKLGLLASPGIAAPYGFVSSLHEALIGVFYAVSGILTNFGANPSFDALLANQALPLAQQRLGTVMGIGFSSNGFVLLFCVGCALFFAAACIRSAKRPEPYTLASMLSAVLLGSTAVSLVMFIATKHYYPVDARYLTIVLFAGVITAVTVVRSAKIAPLVLAAVCVGALALIPIGLQHAKVQYNDQKAALSQVDQRTKNIAHILRRERVEVLAGDYWRVVPVKAALNEPLTVVPFGDCFTPRTGLTSKQWLQAMTLPDAAILVTSDKGLTDAPQCDAASVIARYGIPSRTIVLAGSTEAPVEQLLIYDDGFGKSQPTPRLTEAAQRKCGGKTILQVVAHPDDDLLFFSPDLLHSYDKGDCVRTVYLTAGDGGQNQKYWESRQSGAEQAYVALVDDEQQADWQATPVRLHHGGVVQLREPTENARVSQIYFMLADGGPKGLGFEKNKHETMAKLLSGGIPSMQSLAGSSIYTREQLIANITETMGYYQPDEIRTFSTQSHGNIADHNDHIATGAITTAAYDRYRSRARHSVALTRYVGYPTYAMPENVATEDLLRKEQLFYTYSQFDNATCHDAASCQKTTYSHYLTRQYKDN